MPGERSARAGGSGPTEYAVARQALARVARRIGRLPGRSLLWRSAFSLLTYKAAVGYAGTDTFEVLSISSNGVANLYRYAIKIVDVDSKKKGRPDLRP